VCPKQLEFAELSGFQNTEISALENGKVKIRADHLAQLAAAGIDILYVVTGQRGGDRLDPRESMLLSVFRALDDISQCTILLSGMRMAPEGTAHFTPAAIAQQIVMAVQNADGSVQMYDPQTGVGAAGGETVSVHMRKTVHDKHPSFKGEGE